ncbi:MAG: hypothetical protein WDN67_00105 [Candidatus Moraniibacteriota bacterium]
MTQELVLGAFYFGTLIYAVIIHEVSHGWVALWLGDLTAKYAGRLKPQSHQAHRSLWLDHSAGASGADDWLCLRLGQARALQSYNLRDQKWGPVLVALAGPGSNFLLAFIAALIAKALPLGLLSKQDILLRFQEVLGGQGGFLQSFGLLADSMSGSFPTILFGLLLMVLFWNVVLAALTFCLSRRSTAPSSSMPLSPFPSAPRCSSSSTASSLFLRSFSSFRTRSTSLSARYSSSFWDWRSET